MTIRVLEHNGIYTAYRRVMKRNDDGKLFESVKRIDFPFPPPERDAWAGWLTALTPDALDAGMQIFFDKWNFGRGAPLEKEIYERLYAEIQRRKSNLDGPIQIDEQGGLAVWDANGTMNFPVIKK